MAKFLSSTDVAIAEAIVSKSLNIVELMGREILASDGSVLMPAEPFWSIEDQHGVIETHLSLEAVNNRINTIEERLQ